jgi:hypothetical protein
MPTTTSKKSIQNDKAYESFIEGLQLIDLALKSSTSTLDRDAFFDILGKRKTVIRAFRDDYKITEVGKKYFEAEGRFTLSVSETAESAAVLKMEFVFEIHMHGAAPIWKEGAERFVQSELRLVLVPYARQFVASMTSQMGIPPVVIPLATKEG